MLIWSFIQSLFGTCGVMVVVFVVLFLGIWYTIDNKAIKCAYFMAKINEKKYKNAIIFFAKKIQNGTLGKLKMMKLLYFLDFDFFEKYGRSITGDDYLRFEMGPVPRMGEKMLKNMDGKEIKITKRKITDGYNEQMHIEALGDYNMNIFTKEELIMLEEIADKWEKFTGTEMKNASHGEAPWIATKPNDAIDYNLAYYRNKYGEMARI